MAKASSQKFVARNRAPRVQIEYDVELYGAEKKINLPFVMGVMADLSGNPKDPLPAVQDRAFQEIDVDNFDDRMKAMKPRVAFEHHGEHCRRCRPGFYRPSPVCPPVYRIFFSGSLLFPPL